MRCSRCGLYVIPTDAGRSVCLSCLVEMGRMDMVPWPRWRVATIPQTVYDRHCERCMERKGRPTVFQLLLNQAPWTNNTIRLRICQSCRLWMRHALSNYRLEHEPVPFCECCP